MVVSGVIFMMGLYYYINYGDLVMLEAMTSNRHNSRRIMKGCPNLLIQEGRRIYLKNTNQANVPGINPVIFDNLEEYVEYMKWLEYNNVRCPVLYLKKEYNAQDEPVYKIRPDFLELNSGANEIPPGYNYRKRGNKFNDHVLDNHISPVYKNSIIQGFDNNNQDLLSNNPPLDRLFVKQEKFNKSDNPMDTNWGGSSYSRKQIKKGKYKKNEVYKPTIEKL